MMFKVCAWCKRPLGKREYTGLMGEGESMISHGICLCCVNQVSGIDAMVQVGASYSQSDLRELGDYWVDIGGEG